MNFFISFIGFLIVFILTHLITKKKLDLKQTLIVFLLVIIILLRKTKYNLWLENIDPYFHVGFQFFQPGFPAFGWIQFFIDLTTTNSIFWLPIIFGSLSCYVFLVWLNTKKINLIALTLLLWFFSYDLRLLFSFSKETILILFSLLFFYFLEKFYYSNSRKNLIASLLFLLLACLTKITGFLLIWFFLWVLLQKKRKHFYFLPIIFILSFMLFKTNLAANLTGEGVFITLSLLVVSWSVFWGSSFVLWVFVFFPLFFRFKSFLWQLNAYAFLLIIVVGLKFFFFIDVSLVDVFKRYLIIFLLPLILWLSNEIQLLFVVIKNKVMLYYNKRRENMNRPLLLVLCLFALCGWVLAGFFYLEADGLHEDCQSIIPIVESTVNYYERVCAEDINRDRLWQTLRENKDLNIRIKT